MLPFSLDRSYRELFLVEPWIREVASNREGDYKLTVFARHWFPWLWCSKKQNAEAFSIVFTGKEWSSLSFCIEHALRTGLKEANAYGAFVSKAQQLWPGGSQEEVAMKMLAPHMVLQYLTYKRVVVDHCCFSLRYSPFLKPLDRTKNKTVEATKPDKKDGQGKSEGGGTDDNPKSGGEKSPVQPHVPHVDAEEQPIVDPAPGGTRMADTGSCYAAIVGQEDGHARTVDGEPDIVGGVLLPISREPNVPSDTINNVKKAIKERIDEKQLPCNLTKDETRRIGRLVSASLADNGPFARKRIRAWLAKNFDLAEIKSKKWSEERLRAAVDKLYSTSDPQFSYAAAVKAEQMPEGKPPRMLIADGDPGQVMALMTIACFESLMYEWYENLSIKHASRRAAMKRVLNHLRQDSECSFLEGDGSAWDTTCSHRVRSIVENPVLKRILEVAREQAVVPEQWLEAHDTSTSKKHLKLKLTEKGKKMVYEVIDSIRRSGHRGTSCLNWWINNVLWICALVQNPEKSISATATNFMDFWGETITIKRAFEGDDSGLTVAPKMKDVKDPRFEHALEFWHRAGFNMKIFLRHNVGLFVGTEIALDEHGPTGEYAPELKRTFEKAGISCSSLTKKLIKAGAAGNEGLHEVRRSLALAKAYDFAGIVPSVSRKYLLCAQGLDTMDHELKMRTGETTLEGIRDMIDAANSTCSPEDEDALLERLGRSISQTERDAFEAYCWAWEKEATSQCEEFAASLPASWRV
ncbi:RNA-dependent RNA polymerase [Beihai weivirus-like virus 7]|uniref:RNA-dependent RNA polymerase n=1 Tax=Beihai weivirus-like virus 7 TaxID=1922754 RepID=UPI000909E2E4|nr:RNA-dependent RNA polymerase [Beihai weivirus-like virus 7]APG78101.1 RNA-dependent RNA polymerase [Beihai weivirus-like virus 7]